MIWRTRRKWNRNEKKRIKIRVECGHGMAWHSRTASIGDGPVDDLGRRKIRRRPRAFRRGRVTREVLLGCPRTRNVERRVVDDVGEEGLRLSDSWFKWRTDRTDGRRKAV